MIGTAPAVGVTGGAPAPVTAGLGEIVDHGSYLAGRCVALRVAPGWILTAYHCTGPRREWRDGFGRHALGRVHRAPHGGDVALVESPGNAGPFTPVSRLARACSDATPAVIHSRAHTPRGQLTMALNRTLDVTRVPRCDAGSDVIRVRGRRVCHGDSGAPVIAGGRAVAVVATLMRDEGAREDISCSRDGGEVGEMVAIDGAAGAWIRRAVMSAPPPLPALQARAQRSSSGRTWVILRGALPIEGTPVRLIDQHGRRVAVAPVSLNGVVGVRAIPAGRYRLSIGWGKARRGTWVRVPRAEHTEIEPEWITPPPGDVQV